MVGITSVRRPRRALRYGSWHLLHLYALLSVALSVPHQIWTGRDFTTSGWARAYRWTSYAIVAGAVVLFRVAMPVWRTMRRGISVTSVVRENHDVTLRMGARGERVKSSVVRHEALLFRVGMRGLRRWPVVAGR